MNGVIIIPARLESKRLRNKVILPVAKNKSMIQMTYENCSKFKKYPTYIATDSKVIEDHCKKFTDKILLSGKHESGTDRIGEVNNHLNAEFVLNVQADEPLINLKIIKQAFDSLELGEQMVSFYKKEPYSDINDPNKVKVVINKAGHAMYFSRSDIPHNFHNIGQNNIHIGIYGYSKKVLKNLCGLDKVSIEKTENLEQLRALFHGIKIKMLQTKNDLIGVDTIEDLKKLKKKLKNEEKFYRKDI